MNEFQPLHPSARKVWLLHSLVGSLFILGVPLAVGLIAHFWWLFIPAALWVFYIFGPGPAWEYAQWRYMVGEKAIEVRHGVFFQRHTVVPINRIQHMDVKQGPFLKRYGLSTIAVTTASSVHEIPAIPTETAQELVRALNDTIHAEADDEAR